MSVDENKNVYDCDIFATFQKENTLSAIFQE